MGNRAEEKDPNIADLSALCRLLSDKSVLMVLQLPLITNSRKKKKKNKADEQSLTSKRATRHNCLVTEQITVISSWKGIASGCVGHNNFVYSTAVLLCLRKHKNINMLLILEQQRML